jgi:GNAT superfamily N-acetyltransferase
MTDEIKILSFEDKYSEDFKNLNVEWIKKYFVLEDADLKVLSDPMTSIVNKGGHIYMAELNGEIVGTCALLKMENGEYELAKMAVDEKAQGKQIGYKLGVATIEKARELGGSLIYLETNAILKPALNLYKKLGFADAPDRPTPYERCNVHMEIKF